MRPPRARPWPHAARGPVARTFGCPGSGPTASHGEWQADGPNAVSGHVRRRVVGSACVAPADVNSAFERVGLGLAPVRCSSAGADGVPLCRRAENRVFTILLGLTLVAA